MRLTAINAHWCDDGCIYGSTCDDNTLYVQM